MKKYVLILTCGLLASVAAHAEKIYNMNLGEAVQVGNVLVDSKTSQPITGIARIYFKDRLEIETPYKNGRKEGIEKEYYPDGKLRSEMPYRNGQKEGIGKDYYPDGKLEREILYKDGKKEGSRKDYYPDGKLKSETLYKNGEQIGDVKRY